MKNQKFIITTDAYQNIIKKIGSQQPEKGGILIGKNGIITDFVFDEFAETTGSTYALNVTYLNPIIQEFKKQGKELMGIIHSHPNGCSKLSKPDQDYFAGIFKNATDLDFLFTPIVFSAKENEFHVFPYVFHKDGKIEEVELEIVPNDYDQYIKKDHEPESAIVEERKQLLVIIHQNSENKESQKKDLPISELTLVGVLLSNIYFFVLGAMITVLPIAFMVIIKNLLKS